MPLAVKAGRLIDGTGQAPLQNVTILMEKNRIAVVGGQGEDVPLPAGYDVLDASHYTVIPGLIDCHLHIVGSGEPSEYALGTAREVTRSIPTTTLNCLKNARRSFEAGYTTLRDASCRHYADVALRDAINRGDVEGPRLWCCGLGVTSTTGHMDREKNFAPHVHIDAPTAVADSPYEARRAVRQNLKYNVDFIKINATLSEHVRRYGGACAPEMTKEVMEAIFDEAHWHGRKVTAHCHGGIGVTWAIEAGIDGLEHGLFITDEQFDLMAEKGIAFCPTLSVMGRYREADQKGLNYGGGADLDSWRAKAIAAAWDTTRRAKRHGVMIISGSDCTMPGVIHGTNAFELEMLVEAGLTPMEAIVAATGNAAKGIGFEDVGTVESGKYADLVLVDGDPLADIKILQDHQRIAVIVKDGKVAVDRRVS